MKSLLAGFLFLSLAFNAYASTTSYAIDRNGNIISTATDVRYYNADQNSSSYWGFNDVNNTFYNAFTGGWRTLNTTLFNVSDILDVTYSGYNGNHAWVTTTSGTSYAIDRNGNIISTATDVRYYNADQNSSSYWGFNDVNNTFYNAFTGGWRTLNTTLFNVSDILDVTYSDYNGNHAWITVKDKEVSVPETSSLYLLAFGLLGLLGAARRQA